MRILVTSMVDVKKSAHNRLHQFLRHLSLKNDITVFSINDWWKEGQTDTGLYRKDLDEVLQKTRIKYFTERKASPVFQELFSFAGIGRQLDGVSPHSFDVHLNYGTLVSGYAAARKLKSLGIQTVYDIGDNNPEMIRNSPQIPSFLRPAGGFMGDIMLKKNIGIATRITYVTQAIKDSCHIPKDKSELLPNGVDTALFRSYPSEHLRKSLGLDGKFVVGYVGVLREWVKLEPLFAVLKLLEKDYTDIRMLIVGQEGRFRENKGLASEYGVSDKVVFTGTVPYAQVPQYISCMDIGTIPFEKNGVTSDPCPLKLFEYMACQKPVISALDITAVKDKILYAFNTDEYRDRIVKLHNDPGLQRRLGAEGRKFVEQNYDWTKIAAKLEKILVEAAS
ncbi:MAG: glycosyltransferase family 4 protein [Chloroflexi bacterium]|nr:glycosyltransferase family 4 protein [Chloroflexota bacterium]